MKYLSHILSLFVFLGLLQSCGSGEDSNSSGKSSTAQEMAEVAEVDFSEETTFNAKFTTLNPQVNGTIPGSVTLMRKGDNIYAYTRLFAGGARAWHPQNIYLGNRCPNLSDDTNGDGFIDIVEANLVLGNIIMPLDSDIGSQRGGKNFYPTGDLSGSYYYERVTSHKRWYKDITDEDQDPTDNIVKLTPNENFILGGRVLLIQGVTSSVELPPTVQTIGKHKPFQTLPIVCGTFSRVLRTPGNPDDSHIPGPIADVRPGQDRPAPPGADETSGEI